MVDSRKGKTMTDGLDNLPDRVQTVEQKVDALSTSVDARFDQVDAAIAEQRQYTEFAYDRLNSKMDAGFARIDERFGRIDERFGRIDGRFAQIDGRFAQMDGRFARLERKLDQFIDTQSKTNELVERRLHLWEPPPSGSTDSP